MTIKTSMFHPGALFAKCADAVRILETPERDCPTIGFLSLYSMLTDNLLTLFSKETLVTVEK
jgi:hypothetical protein